MTRQPIESSALKSVAHDAEKQILEIEFKTGKVWRYHPVPADVHARMIDPENSAGKIFTAEVRNNPAVGSALLEASCPSCGGEYTCIQAVCPAYETAVSQ